ARWVVAAARIHFDVAETALREMRLEAGDRPVVGHVGYEPKIELRDGTMRHDGLAARAGISSDEAFDVDRRGEHEALERRAPRKVSRPALRAEERHRSRLTELRRRLIEHLALCHGGRLRFPAEPVDGGIAIGVDQGRERLDETERRTVEARSV